MEVFGAVGAAVGLAATVQTAKAIRDIIKLAMSEISDIADLIEENEEEMQLLHGLYNKHKELFDQTELTEDLERLQMKMKELNNFLLSQRENTSDGKLPNVKEIWRAGDLKPKLEAWNRRINRVRTTWQDRVSTRTLALVRESKTEILDRMDSLSRANANASLAVVETIRSEATEVIKVIQQSAVRQRVRTLSMHSQVEPTGSNGQTTRVFADVSTSSIRFSILSPDASLSYDCIKLRLQEYKDLLATDSSTIEFKTETGRIVLCRKTVDKMEGFLSEAEQLLQGMIETPDVSTTTVIHRLRYLAQLLDKLQLESECRLVGDCAIKLSQIFALHYPDFRREQAQTIACIAGLRGYHRQVPTLFTRAVSICEGIVVEDDSALNNLALLDVLSRAGHSSMAYPDLGAQWGGRAIRLMTKMILSTKVTNIQLGINYFNYGQHLSKLRMSPEAIDAYRKAVFYYRTSAMEEANKTELGRNLINSIMRHEPGAIHGDQVENDIVVAILAPRTRIQLLADALSEYGWCLLRSGQHSTAERIGRAAMLHYNALAIMDPAQDRNHGLTDSLIIVFLALKNHGKFGEPATFQEGISIIRSLVAQDSAPHSAQLTLQLAFYESNLALLEKVLKAKGPEEVISLYSVRFMDDPAEHSSFLATALELYASFLTMLDKHSEAAASREKALSLYRSLVSHNPAKSMIALTQALWKYWGLLREMGRVTEAVEIGRETVAYLQTVVKSQTVDEKYLSTALHSLGWDYATLGQHANAIPTFEESISLSRDLVTKDAETHTWNLANSIHDMAISLHALECHERAEVAAAECIQLCKGKTLKECQYEPNLNQCFVCRRVAIVASPSCSAVPGFWISAYL